MTYQQYKAQIDGLIAKYELETGETLPEAEEEHLSVLEHIFNGGGQ